MRIRGRRARASRHAAADIHGGEVDTGVCPGTVHSAAPGNPSLPQ
jgi:hypothetical protein